jgi:hypothetical protein
VKDIRDTRNYAKNLL